MSGARRAGDPGNELRPELRLLGPFEVSRGGLPVPVGGPKPRALLAALALEAGRVVSADRLVEDLWPAEAPETAGHAVQVYVSQLRRALGTDAISTRKPGYVLELDRDRIDVHRFARLADEGRAALQGGDPAAAESALREALALWRGSALLDFTYEPFAQAEIARLEELRLVALEERVDADLELGRHAELVAELEALVNAQPLRERPRTQLMLALYRAGRQADALAAYRAARETLVEELGIDPGPGLRELEAAILRQDESLRRPDTVAPVTRMQFRRLVTILFVDVVESMALAEALDPEALGRVLQRYFETASSALTRHGGTVEKYAGDAVMAAFGIPVSHEDDALRAARAALDVRAGIAALSEQLEQEHGLGLEVRIGLESGEVVATETDARQRLVTGEAVGVAARLEEGASAGEIAVGEVAGRLIDHAAELEPLGEVEIRGKREPVSAYLLHGLRPVAPAFERRLDAPLVGRKRELAALRKRLKLAVDTGTLRATVVLGPPGVGKSRLVAELGRRGRGVTVLWGRCLSYGDGITYWPLREVLEQASAGEERDAVLAALAAPTPPPAAEIALLFRRLCERLAREQPLVLVLDDAHWAEPTLLELIEQLVDRGEGPILLACVAREELLEARPGFLGDRENAARVELGALTAEETDALLDGLGGAILESDQHARIVDAAEGNPFFLEQLLALSLEGGLGERGLPETIQALLAARLDRLGPGERAVLERGSVVGKEFTADDVTALLEPHAAPTADTHLRTLSARGFVRPGPGGFAFRHVLVQEAVYRAAPKRLRAELHERYADRLDAITPDVADLDEFVGHHLEQAQRLLGELGESDRRTARLAEDGGRRLGEAGLRAFKRGDMHATVNLLGRATSLVSEDAPLRQLLLAELGIALRNSGDSARALEVLGAATEAARAAGDRRLELRAKIEREYVLLQAEAGTTADALLAAAAEGIPIFEAVGDDRSLGRAWLLSGFLRGGHLGQHEAWKEAAERALVHYARSGWPTSSCVGEIAAALHYGPTPVEEALARCDELVGDPATDSVGRANVTVYTAGLVAQLGDFDRARALVADARETFDDLGQRTAATNSCSTVLGEIELLAGDWASAELVLRELCAELEQLEDLSHLASRAGDLADALYLQGRVDEAGEWTRVAETHASEDDFDAALRWRPVRALVHASQGEHDQAERLARESARQAELGDGLNRQARVHASFGEILRLAGRSEEAAGAFDRAVELYEQKGNVVGAGRARKAGELAVA
jgi:DNA-binding SARP family transcriptional activator